MAACDETGAMKAGKSQAAPVYAEADLAAVAAFAKELSEQVPASRLVLIDVAVRGKSPALVALDAIIDAKRVAAHQTVTDTPYPDPQAEMLPEAARTVRHEMLRWLLSKSLNGIVPDAANAEDVNPYGQLHSSDFKVDFIVKDLAKEQLYFQKLYERHTGESYLQVSYMRHLAGVLERSKYMFNGVVARCVGYISDDSTRYRFEAEQYLKPILAAVSYEHSHENEYNPLSANERGQLEEITEGDNDFMCCRQIEINRSIVYEALLDYCDSATNATDTFKGLDITVGAQLERDVEERSLEAA